MVARKISALELPPAMLFNVPATVLAGVPKLPASASEASVTTVPAAQVCVAPGLVISTDDYDAEQEERLASMMPLGALPSPSGVADAVLYLAGAKDVTGQTIFVDGGASLKSFDRDFMYL